MPRPPAKRPKDVSFEFDINKMPRSRPAWEAAISLLNDYKHHYYLDVMYTMLEASDLKPSTTSSLITQMIKQDLIRESPDGRWLYRPQYLPLAREWPQVYNSPDGVHTTQEEKRNNEDLPTP